MYKRTLSLLLCLLTLLGGVAAAEQPKETPLVVGLPPAPTTEPQFQVVASQPALVPTPGTQMTGQQNSFWETPMDITDTAAVWAMLTAPITVVKGNQRNQTVLRSQPDDSSEAVADITYDSQGVHVLETLNNGWSLVEAYSSSFHDSKIKAWNKLTRGYIRTDMLQQKKVNQKYGLVIDKLTQELYIFEDGKLMDTLLVSTGLVNERQPYNETRSGEFLIVSPVGDFKSDNVVGAMALRFNRGDFIHEVVHIPRSSGKVYEPFEEVLGERASHGCIRVQRKRTPTGTNHTWLWNNLRKDMGTIRVAIWEDLPGRQIPVPDPATPLYYNTQGGRDYHKAPTCYGVRDKFYPLHEFRYDQLEQEPYNKLGRCAYCYPPLRLAQIEQLNQNVGALGLR